MVDKTHLEIGLARQQRDWRRPELRKLPIATTAASGKAIISGNDGDGAGKGDVAILNS